MFYLTTLLVAKVSYVIRTKKMQTFYINFLI